MVRGVVFTSDADVTGDNTDLSGQLFLFETATSALVQLTDIVGEQPGDMVFGVGEPEVDADGSHILYELRRSFDRPPNMSFDRPSELVLTRPLPPTQFDFGDAPIGYPTTVAEDGARHDLVGPVLGTDRDGELDATHSAAADFDDLNGDTPDDEDGFVSGGLIVPGQRFAFTLEASQPAFVDAWIDFDGNGTWDNPDEKFLDSVPVVAGINGFNELIPTDATPGMTSYARFRISTAGGLLPTGLASDGEVEDYEVTIEDVNVFVVNSVGDGGDANTSDDLCDDGGGVCTLRRPWNKPTPPPI